jgi:hypothetical protein
MATFHLLKSEVKPLTREIAKQFAEMTPSPTERDLNPQRLRMLQNKAENGELVTFHWATAKLGDKRLRMNGQHSSTMLTGLNGEFPEGLYVHLDDYEVDDEIGLAALFRQFDDRKSGRSASDVAGAYQGLFPDLQPVPKAIAKLGVEGIGWWRRFVEGAPVPSGDDLYKMFHEPGIHPFLVWLGSLFSIKTPELRKAQVVAAMYATFNANQAEAERFWERVAAGGMEYEDNHPTTILDAWLKAAKEGTLKDELKPAQFYQGCIYAWNAYREEKPIKDIKADTKKSWYTPHA